MTTLQAAAQAVLDRWDSPYWKWNGPTGDLMSALRAALAQPSQPAESYELIGAANGFYGGRPTIRLLNPTLVLPQGVALYMRTVTPPAIKETP